MPPLLTIKNLRVTFTNDGIINTVVKDINFAIEKGKITALVGESGSGKSITALSLLKLLPPNANATGEILFCNCQSSTNLLHLSSKKSIPYGAIVFP